MKRIASGIFNRGGIIRKIDNLGQQPTPYKMSAHGFVQREAGHFIIHFDAPPRKIEDLLEECGRDIDIIRNRVYKKEVEPSIPCTFDEEMLPPSYRYLKIQTFYSTSNFNYNNFYCILLLFF